jgi:hypothetical protein
MDKILNNINTKLTKIGKNISTNTSSLSTIGGITDKLIICNRKNTTVITNETILETRPQFLFIRIPVKPAIVVSTSSICRLLFRGHSIFFSDW